MSLPAELLVPVPRPTAALEQSLGSPPPGTATMAIIGVAVAGVSLGVFTTLWGLSPGTGVLALGLGALVALAGWAMQARRARTLQLYREGQASLGQVAAVSVTADHGNGTSVTTITVEFNGAQGLARGHALLTLPTGTFALRVGDSVPVLAHRALPHSFAVFLPAQGIHVGGIVK